MKSPVVPTLSKRQRALGPLIKTCPKCGRPDVVVGCPVDGSWIVQPHSPKAGGTVGCTGADMKIPLTAEEKASP